MNKKMLMLGAMLLTAAISVFAQDSLQVANENSSGGGMDWFEILIFGGYFIGVLILLPIVIYTNLKEGLYNFSDEENRAKELMSDLSEDERNHTAAKVLERIEEKLTPFQAEDGSEMVTITKGGQAKFMKRGLDYINKNLQPTDTVVKARIKEFTEVYEDRASRAFTGSWWIIICSTGIGVLMVMTGGFNTFIIIHSLGLLFYVLSSRTTMYGIESRMKTFNFVPGFIGGIMTALFLGNGTKHYVKSGSGPWKRDWETEGSMAMIGLLFMAIAAMILGFLAALLGVINFVFNYSTSFLLPLKSDEKWFDENFTIQSTVPELV